MNDVSKKLFDYLKKQTILKYLTYIYIEGPRHIDARLGTINKDIKLKFKDWEEAFKQTVLLINKLKDYEKAAFKKIEKDKK